MKNISFVICLLLILLACKEDQLNRNYAIVHTDPPSNISVKSVTFSGNFSNALGTEVTDHGFVWSKSKTLSLASSEAKHLGVPGATTFLTEVTSQMPSGSVYFRAFIVSKTATVYGNLQTFSSANTLDIPLTITDFSPKSGVAGDTLTITGTGFSETLSLNKVNFIYDVLSSGGVTVALKVTKVTSHQIKAVIPANIKFRTMTIEVTSGTSTTTFNGFQYKSPGIVDVPVTLRVCDTLIVNWESYSQTLLAIKLNDFNVVPIKVTDTQIKLILNVLSNSLKIRIVTASGFADEKSFGFSPDQHLAVTSTFPNTVSIADTLTFAYNFPGCNTTPATGISYAEFVRVGGTDQNPKYIMKGFDHFPSPFTIKFSFNDPQAAHLIFTSPNIEPKSIPWRDLKSQPSLARKSPASFSLNGKGYITCGNTVNGLSLTDTWEYDPAGDKWTKKSDFPAFAGTGASAFVIGSKAYIVFPSTRHFWSYDPVTDTWTQLPFFPGSSGAASRFVAAIASIGYVAGANGDLWAYDPSLNTWTSKAAAPPISSQGDVVFTRNGKGILYTLDNTSGKVKAYIYDPGANSWQAITTDFKPAFDYFNLYALNFSGSTYLIDAFTGLSYKAPIDLSKPWTFAGYAAIAQKNGGFDFIVNEKGYIGLGEVSGQSIPVSSPELVEFDPSKF
jgi:hypothetical protein